MHALGEYGLMHVKLYEDIARFGHIATSYAYPVKVNDRYVMGPVADPKVRQPQDGQLSGAAAVRRRAREADLCDRALHPSGVARLRGSSVTRYRFDAPCALCAADDSYLDEIVTDDQGSRIVRLLRHRLLRGPPGPGHRGTESAAPHKEGAHG